MAHQVRRGGGEGGRTGHGRDHRRPDPGRARCARAPGLRRLPHRPPLPRGRDQRRVPVPPRPRGRRRRRGRRTRRRGSRAGRLRDPELASRVRHLPGLSAGPALVLLRHPQRHPEDDLPTASSSSPALGIGAFAERPWWRPASAPRSILRAGRRRRASSAAASWPVSVRHVHRRGQPRRQRRVFGCGGVGDAAIAGARLAGATKVIAVDLDAGKLELARDFGATHTVDASGTDPVEAIRPHRRQRCRRRASRRWATRRCWSRPSTPRPRRHRGAGRRASPDMSIDLPMIEFFGRGGASSRAGTATASSRDFPMLIDLYLQGRLDLDRFVSETIGIDGVEEAFHRMEQGEVLPLVVVLDERSTRSSPRAPSRSTGRASTSTTTSGWWATTRRS